MSTIQQANIRNRLLARLSVSDYALLEPHTSRRSFQLRDLLIESGQPIRDFYFPDTGMISIVTGDDSEVGLVGREGVSGIPALLGVDSGPLRAMCQMPSDGTVIPVAGFLAAAAESASLSDVMLRYVHTFTVQVAHTAYTNGNFTLEQRLARWVLMCHDRRTDDAILVTHEFLSMMLNVRRPGITVATHVLEGHGFIRAKRGRIEVRDVERLRDFADGSYGLAEAEYERVLGDRVEVNQRRGLKLGSPSLSVVN